MPNESEKSEPDRSQPVPNVTKEPETDGFPADKDVSTPPKGSDQADDDEE